MKGGPKSRHLGRFCTKLFNYNLRVTQGKRKIVKKSEDSRSRGEGVLPVFR